jgi:hypothetical protein
MLRRVRLLLIVASLTLACGPKPTRNRPTVARGEGVEITLYRDHAVVAHRVKVTIPPASTATVRIKVAAGVEPDDLYPIEDSPLSIREVKIVGAEPVAAPQPKPPVADEILDDPCAIEDPCADGVTDEVEELLEDKEPPPPRPIAPTEVELVIGGPREGTYIMVVGYDTARISWEAAYTLTTSPARDEATLRGALAVRNATGLAMRGVNVWVADVEHGPITARIAQRKGIGLVGHDGKPTNIATPRDLGTVDIADGDTRIELLAGAPRKMRSVLVYDPIGTKLDHPGSTPVRDTMLGVVPPAPTRVSESFEIERDVDATIGLPAGPVRLLERRADGSLALLGESRMFDTATQKARVDAIAIGTAEGITGKRTRREFTIDDPRKRLAEDFKITIDNTRATPVDIVVRDHLYRGENWTLAYVSLPLEHATQEGSQQIALRTRVPSKGRLEVLYTVVYTWGPCQDGQDNDQDGRADFGGSKDLPADAGCTSPSDDTE